MKTFIEKIKMIWAIIFARQYICVTLPRKFDKVISAVGGHFYISDYATPLFLSSSSDYIKKYIEENHINEQYDMVGVPLLSSESSLAYLKKSTRPYIYSSAVDKDNKPVGTVTVYKLTNSGYRIIYETDNERGQFEFYEFIDHFKKITDSIYLGINEEKQVFYYKVYEKNPTKFIKTDNTANITFNK